MIEDFHTFYFRFLLSLPHDAPLEENLRALMAPALGKLRHHTGAEVAVHLFANPLLRELHAMAVGADPATRSVLHAEAAFRHQPAHAERSHRRDLPAYQAFELSAANGVEPLFDATDPVPRRVRGADLLWLLELIAARWPAELAGGRPDAADTVVVIPLGTGDHARLGTFLLWGHAGGPLETRIDDALLKELVAFRKSFEQVMIQVFTNLYGMVPSTYLPSFHQAGSKPAALLCAEIRGFDRVSEILRGRNDFTPDQTTRCLSSLVKDFSRTAADLIEGNQGRVDQMWGNGILGVFGEHLGPGSPESATIGCMRALTAASRFVQAFTPAAERWLREEFDIDWFRSMNPEEIRVEAIALVDYGPVVFEYVGSAHHQSYMTLGDRVDFVKAMIRAADHHATSQGIEVSDRPILLSQTAYRWTREMLREVPPEVAGHLATPHPVTLPGKPAQFPVHFVRPANVQGSAR